MKKIKKKYIIVGVIAVVLICAIPVSLLYIKNKKTPIVVSNWDGEEKRYVVCKAKTLDEPSFHISDCETLFEPESDEELQEALEQNPDYLGEIVYYEWEASYDAKLFYSDNNYFVGYYNEHGYYCVRACYSKYKYNGSIVNVPMPIYLIIDEEVFEVEKEYGINSLDYLFDSFSFEEACEFYNRFDPEYVSIDEENHKIHVSGYDRKSNELIPDCVIINFDDRTLDGMGENGERIIIDGK